MNMYKIIKKQLCHWIPPNKRLSSNSGSYKYACIAQIIAPINKIHTHYKLFYTTDPCTMKTNQESCNDLHYIEF